MMPDEQEKTRLNRRMAEVMGWVDYGNFYGTVVKEEGAAQTIQITATEEDTSFGPAWSPSTNIAQAMMVVEELRNKYEWLCSIHHLYVANGNKIVSWHWGATFFRPSKPYKGPSGEAKTIEGAITLAADKVLQAMEQAE